MVSLVNFMCQNLNIVFEINITTENNSCQVYLTFLFFCLDTKETKSQARLLRRGQGFSFS